MTLAAGSGGGAGAGSSAVTLDMIRGVHPQRLRTAAESLSRGSTTHDGQHGLLLDKVHNPLVSGLDWSGVGQPQAAARTSKQAGQVSGVSKRLGAATIVLNGPATYLDAARSTSSTPPRRASDRAWRRLRRQGDTPRRRYGEESRRRRGGRVALVA